MRKIEKSSRIPKSLINAPVPRCQAEVYATIYKADDVRDQLVADQHSKCAYCECSLTKEYNDVEHYRPKSIYYQLGHEWTNLLYACPKCNRSCKRDEFPLKDESQRGNIAHEEPLIINPTTEDPSEHIVYNRYMMVPLLIDGVEDQKGRTTIDLLKLNDRPDLVYARKQLYELYELEVIKISKLIDGILQDKNQIKTPGLIKIVDLLRLQKETLRKYQAPEQPYSGMLIAQSGI